MNYFYTTAFVTGLLFLTACSEKNTPALPDLTKGVTYTGTKLKLLYDGNEMPGKTARVTLNTTKGEITIDFSAPLDLSFIPGLGLSSTIEGPGVTPGESSLTLTAPYTVSEGKYIVGGKSSTTYLNFSYVGEIGEESMEFSLNDCILKDTSLTGYPYTPNPIEKNGLMDFTSLPFHLVWELDPAAGISIPLSEILKIIATAPVIPVYQGTAYTSFAQAFISLVKTIRFNDNGDIPVMYVSTLGGAAHISTTSPNMLQYVPTQEGLRLFINPLSVGGELLLAMSDNKEDAKFDFEEMLKKAPSASESPSPDEVNPALKKAMVEVLLKTLAPQIQNGVPLSMTTTAGDAEIFFDTQTSITFLSNLLQTALENPTIAAAITDYLRNLDIPSLPEEDLEGFLQQIPIFLLNTTRLEIGLSLRVMK